MKTIGYRQVQLDKLILDGSFKRRQKELHVVELAKSLDSDLGQLNAPIVRSQRGKGMTLLAGNDRVAAHFVAKHKTCECKVVECDDDQARRIIATENAHRRHDPAEQRTALLALTEQLAQDIVDKEPAVRKEGRGRTKTAKGMAREIVAKQRGISAESLRVQEHRDKKKREGKVPTEKTGEEPPIKSDMELGGEFLKQVAQTKELLMDAARHCKNALSCLSKLAHNDDLPKHKSRLDGRREELQEVSDAIRALVPEMLCPFCKGVPKVTKQCTACDTSAYISKSQVEVGQLPDVFLLTGEDAVVLYQGKTLPLVQFLDEELPDNEDDSPREEAEQAFSSAPLDGSTPYEPVVVGDEESDPFGDVFEGPPAE